MMEARSCNVGNASRAATWEHTREHVSRAYTHVQNPGSTIQPNGGFPFTSPSKHNLAKAKLTHNQTNGINSRDIQATLEKGETGSNSKTTRGSWDIRLKTRERNSTKRGSVNPCRFGSILCTLAVCSDINIQILSESKAKIKTTTRPAKINRKLVESCVGDAVVLSHRHRRRRRRRSSVQDTRKRQEGSKLSTERKLSEKYNFWFLHTTMLKTPNNCRFVLVLTSVPKENNMSQSVKIGPANCPSFAKETSFQ